MYESSSNFTAWSRLQGHVAQDCLAIYSRERAKWNARPRRVCATEWVQVSLGNLGGFISQSYLKEKRELAVYRRGHPACMRSWVQSPHCKGEKDPADSFQTTSWFCTKTNWKTEGTAHAPFPMTYAPWPMPGIYLEPNTVKNQQTKGQWKDRVVRLIQPSRKRENSEA